MHAAPPPTPWLSPTTPVIIERRYRVVRPFAPGGHRGIDLRARAGAPVRAPCSGSVTFQGSVAGGPTTVTIDCGSLRATLQRLAPTVAAGARVQRGERIGTALGAAVDLSARTPDGRYRDPAPLLGVTRPGTAPPLAPPPARRLPRAAPRPPSTATASQGPPQIADRALVSPQSAAHARVAAPQATPVDVPLALTGAAACLVAGAVALRRRRGRRRPGRPRTAARLVGSRE